MQSLGGLFRFIQILVLSGLGFYPLSLAAQNPQGDAAVLIADQLFITRERVLVAAGNVEAFHGGVHMSAQKITYDRSSGSLIITGPITLTDNDGTVILADAAQLDDGLRNGILRGARVVIEEQLQLAALQVDRVDGRYHQLYKTAVTSCRVCNSGKPPLWQIRAERVIHDTVERQLYFDRAQLRIGRIPVIWLPRLRLPDPTVKRATGFLIPSLRTTSRLGTGIKLPYFIKIGDHRDVTVTPYLSSSTRTLELRYRHAFANGRIETNLAATRDDLRPNKLRGYLFAHGLLELARGYKLSFKIQSTSDDAYLTEYGYTAADRLRSDINIWRAKRDKFVRVSFVNFKTLRAGEVNATMPTFILEGEYERRFFPSLLRGGELRFSAQVHSHRRTSRLNIDGPDPDSIPDGRDIMRFNANLFYQDGATFRGLRTDWQFGLKANAFDVSQDAIFAGSQSGIHPYGAITMRYPLTRLGQSGATHLLEPIFQIGWTGGKSLNLPNEESTRVEFDQGNLLAMSRFPQADRNERGLVAAMGLNWSSFNPGGWDSALTIAQVFRKEDNSSFSATSGLSGTTSNVLIAGQIKGFSGLSLTGRGLFDGDFSLSKAELRGEWRFDRGRIGGSYVWLHEDPAENRTRDVSEIALAGQYDLNRNWVASSDWRYDTKSGRAATAGLGLRYTNECVRLDFSVNRRYTSSTSVEPSTDIGFNIGLRGFSASTGNERYVRSCSN